jgi:hypothetical protein
MSSHRLLSTSAATPSWEGATPFPAHGGRYPPNPSAPSLMIQDIWLQLLPAAQPLNPAFLRMIESIRAPPWMMILIFFFLKVHPPLWQSNLLLLSWNRSQTPENRDPLCIWFHRSALWAVSGSRQSTHTRIPTVLEE